jgi:hypothetical protein
VRQQKNSCIDKLGEYNLQIISNYKERYETELKNTIFSLCREKRLLIPYSNSTSLLYSISHITQLVDRTKNECTKRLIICTVYMLLKARSFDICELLIRLRSLFGC